MEAVRVGPDEAFRSVRQGVHRPANGPVNGLAAGPVAGLAPVSSPALPPGQASPVTVGQHLGGSGPSPRCPYETSPMEPTPVATPQPGPAAAPHGCVQGLVATLMAAVELGIVVLVLFDAGMKGWAGQGPVDSHGPQLALALTGVAALGFAVFFGRAGQRVAAVVQGLAGFLLLIVLLLSSVSGAGQVQAPVPHEPGTYGQCGSGGSGSGCGGAGGG